MGGQLKSVGKGGKAFKKKPGSRKVDGRRTGYRGRVKRGKGVGRSKRTNLCRKGHDNFEGVGNEQRGTFKKQPQNHQKNNKKNTHSDVP